MNYNLVVTQSNLKRISMAGLRVMLCQIVLFILCFRGSKNKPEEIYAVRGENVSFGCQFNGSKSSFTLSWFLNERLILFHDPQSRQEEESSGSYTSAVTTNGTKVRFWIRNVQFRDAGSYFCRKSFISFGQPVSCSWELKVQGIPLIVMEEGVVTENSPVLADCCVEYSLELANRNITWLMNGNRDFPRKSSLPKTVSFTYKDRVCSTVTFQSSRQHHGQKLQCFAENELNISASSNIRVKYPAKINLLSEKYTTVKRDDSVNITCKGEGNPLPSIVLQLKIDDNGWINLSVDETRLYSTKTILIKSFYVEKIPEKESFFRCIAYNNIGPSSFSQEAKTAVQFLGTVEMLTVSPIIVYETNFVVKCQASGLPVPDIYLQKQHSSGKWFTLPVEPSNGTQGWEWMLDVSEKYSDGESFRCVANNTLDDLAVSEAVVIKYKVSLKDFIMKNLTIIVTSVAVTLSVLLTAFFVRYCRARRSQQQYSAGAQREYNVLNVVNDDYEQPPRPPTRQARPHNNRPVPMPPTTAESQSFGGTVPRNEAELGYVSATLPARDAVKLNVGTCGVKYATVQQKHLQESTYY